MSPDLVRALYNLLLPPALLASLPAQLVKWRRRGGSRRDLAQRLGYFDADTLARLASLEKPWWVHAVSVGEVLVAAKLIRAARTRDARLPIVLSTTTTTGHAVATREVPSDVPVLHNPVDLPGAVRRALDAVRPGRLILVEAEVWPNLLHAAQGLGLEVALINARLSPRSERRYRTARSLTAPILGTLDRVLVPEPEDIDRWSGIGVRPEAIQVTGSLKHDYEGQPDDPRTSEFAALLQSLWGGPLPPILLAASTHPGEESLIARVFLDLRHDLPDLRLLVVPRHAERSQSVFADLTALGLSTARLSAIRSAGAAVNRSTIPDALVIDTTGELRAWQPLASAVVIGKSFLSEGGQNPVEALMAGRPVVTGPHMENFAPLMRSLLDHHAVVQVPDAEGLRPALLELLTVPAHAARLTAGARSALAPHQGAARRTAELLLDPTWAD
jgi:3-deoxy-D-manno-octulosonic-acid transferase